MPDTEPEKSPEERSGETSQTSGSGDSGGASGSGGTRGTGLTGPPPQEHRRSGGARFWMIMVPAVAFLLGVALGAIVVAAGSTESGATASTSPGASASTSAPPGTSSSTSERAPATITVPGACLQVADDSQRLLDLVNQIAAAARDLDAARLSDLVRQVQDAQTVLQRDTQACRSAGVSLSSS